MDGWMTRQMDEMMLHVTTSFNICNNNKNKEHTLYDKVSSSMDGICVSTNFVKVQGVVTARLCEFHS
jgi:hypothetical protein